MRHEKADFNAFLTLPLKIIIDLSYHHVNFPFDGNIEREAVLTLHLYYRYIK